MIGPTDFIDEIDCGSFFDHIDDLLDFPNDDVDAGLSASDSVVNATAWESIWTTQSESFPGSDSVFSNNSASDLSADLSVPYEDIVQLEWLSNFVDDSNCGASLTIMKQEPDSSNKGSSDHDHHQFQTSSPVSVLESSSSCSGEKPVAGSGKCGRARSKRPRPATFNPRPSIQLISPSSSFNNNGINVPRSSHVPRVAPDSENYAESRLLIKLPCQVNSEQKKKKIKLTLPAPPTVNITTQNQSEQAVRKCMHCEITKTPQWRAGPMGPKTLCNACGVRYKSGRLFPEYRPAASPTFIPSIHSNSHKKVLEMRTKIGTACETTNSPEMIPNKNDPTLDYIQRDDLGFGEF